MISAEAVSPQIRVLLVEDSRILRDGLTALRAGYEDITVVDAMPTTQGVVDEVARLDPDVVLMDLGLRASAALKVIRSMLARDPAVKVVVMDLLPVQTDTLDFIQAGVVGFLLKEATEDQFINVVRLVAGGGRHLPPPMTAGLFSQIMVGALRAGSAVDLDSVALTRREKQVVELIAEGLSNKEIAQRLNLATQTVKSHVHNVLRKLSCETRGQVAAFALSRHERDQHLETEDGNERPD
jgi:DNA-binding NarL/FixJ family response regulator